LQVCTVKGGMRNCTQEHFSVAAVVAVVAVAVAVVVVAVADIVVVVGQYEKHIHGKCITTMSIYFVIF